MGESTLPWEERENVTENGVSVFISIYLLSINNDIITWEAAGKKHKNKNSCMFPLTLNFVWNSFFVSEL